MDSLGEQFHSCHFAIGRRPPETNTLMAQETEPVASALEEPSALESPSPSKRRNRKKGRRGSAVEEDEEQEAAVSPCADDSSVATADLISLPSPVASASSSVDVFATTLETTSIAMDQLVLTQKKTNGKEDGLLKLPMHPSSGRLPLTPPPTPEPFLMHSPVKEQAQVVPMDVEQLLPTVEEVDVAMEQESESPVEVPVEVEEARVIVAEQDKLETSVKEMEVHVAASVEPPMELVEPLQADVPLEQDTITLSNNLADMALDNGLTSSAEPTELTEKEPAVDVIPAEVIASAATLPVEHTPVADDHVVMANVEVKSITADLIEDNVVPSAELITRTEVEQDPVEVAVAVKSVAEISSNIEQAPAQNAAVEAIATLTQREEHTNAGKSKLMATKDYLQPQAHARLTKRKGDVSDTKPPPAPVATLSKEIRPKRLLARSSSGSMLNKVKPEPEGKPKPEITSQPAHDAKKDSMMMNPTASSIARATAAEARKALLKSAAAKKTPIRKPTKARLAANSTGSVSSLSTDQGVAPPPAPVAADADDDSLRNVKRRLNAVDAEAASRRLYEDAKEAKLRKNARRAELQETYTFAPQVNNFKRRTAPGESQDPNQDHFSRLHAQAKNLLEKKRELQQQHERDGCTFAPTISARAKRLPQKSSGPRYENLYKHAQELKQKREEKLMEKARTTEEECPFKPKIKASKSPVKTKPLYDSEREKQKRLALEQKKIEAEMSECTFKPKVTAKRLKAKAEEPSDVHVPTDSSAEANPYNRLYQASIERTERLQKLRQERDEEEKAQAPFQPKITARSRFAKGQAKAKQPFHKRLYNKDYMKKLDAEREQRRLEEEQQFTFKPEINEPPEEIKTKVNERASPRKSIFERLYDEKDKMKEKIEMSEELRLQKEMAECTFRPQIEADAALGNGEPAPPVWERLLSYDKAQVIEEREKLKEQLEMQECTFKPEVKSPDSLSMKRSPSFNVFERLTGNSPLDPTRSNFITRRPSSSPGRQSPDTKGVSIGRIIKSTKFTLPAERKAPIRTYSVSQPSSVNKQAIKRSMSFSGPKSACSSPTMSMGDVFSRLQASTSTVAVNGDATQLHSLSGKYESWSAELDAKLRHL